MKPLFHALFWSCMLLVTRAGYAQQATNVVDFQVTYDATTTRYTAWVVPRYNLPNSNNSGTTEKGGTAQFTIKVPSSFSIVDIQDVRGVWEKAPLRLGPGNPNQDWTGAGLDPATNYYVIVKSPGETDYGTFANGTPVALFTFRGNGCFGPVSPLDPGNNFIAEADRLASFNVANSFYSRSAQPAGGNQNPLEQFRTVFGDPGQCSLLVANPDARTTTAGTTINIPVLTTDVNNGQPISTTDVTVSLLTSPPSGTATVKPNGTIDYTSAPGFSGVVSFSYTICNKSQPTLCSTARVDITVLSDPPQPADLLITKQVSQSTSTIGSTVSFTVTVQNQGPGGATDVVVTDNITRNLSVQLQGTPVTSKGSFDPATGIWTVGNMTANEAVILVIAVRLLAEGIVTNNASVTASGSQDPNTNNNQASACTSVPYLLCSGESILASVPSNYQNVRWFLNDSTTPINTGNSILITQTGKYTTTATNNACPVNGCCPIIVQEGNCCPADLCIPFVIRKTKSR